MLMAPTFVPVNVPVVGLGVEGAGFAVEAVAAGELAGVEEPPVWAAAEITKIIATARTHRSNLLVIGSPELLGTCSLQHASGYELPNIFLRSFLQSALGRTE
jgi:hypothetical protein